ncbi:hypothetical protein Tco_1553052, partial [Tanacetum coccineum]
IAIRELRNKLEIAQKEKDEIQFNVNKFENASKSLDKLIDSQIVDICKKGLGYNAVPPPYTGNFMPPKPDLSFTGLEEFTNEPVVIKPVVENIKPVVEKSEAKASEAKPKAVRKNNGNFMPPKPDLSFSGLKEFTSDPIVIKPVVEKSEAKASEAKPKAVRKNNGAPIIKDWVSDSEEENIFNQRVNTIKDKNVNAARPKAVVNAA